MIRRSTIAALFAAALLCAPASAAPVEPYVGGKPVSSTNPLPISGSSSINGFHIESSLTPQTITSGGVSSPAFTAGKSVVTQNVGSIDMFCAPGASASQSSQKVAAGQWFEFTTTSETAITCITASSTTTANYQVGTGIATGNGGAGSGGGGSVTQGTSPWVDNITQLANTVLGAPTVWGSVPSGSVIGVNANVLASVLPTGASTAANQATEIAALTGVSATTAHGCAIAGYGILACLGQIDDDVKGPLTSQATTVGIGGVGLFAGGSIMSPSNPLNVAQSGSTPTTTTMQNAAVANSNGTTLNTTGMSAAMLTVNCAACSGGTTINFEGTQDGTNYTAVNAVLQGTATIASSTATSGIAVWELPNAGFASVRARISGYSAGTVTVTGTTVPVPYNAKVVNANLFMAGSAVSANAGASDSGTQRVSANLAFQGTEAVADPCQTVAKSYTPINISASGSVRIITGTAAKKTYICHIDLVTNAANNVIPTEGTGSNCGTNTFGLVGGTTAATGWNFSANGGISLGNGASAVLGPPTTDSNATAADVCLNPSANTQLSGQAVWVQK